MIAAALATRAQRAGERDDATPTYEDEVVARVTVAAIRSAAVRDRSLLATGAESPGISRLLDRAFAPSPTFPVP